MYRVITGLLVLFLSASLAWAASSVTQEHYSAGALNVVEIHWTADATSAEVSDTVISWPINGMIYMAETSPAAVSPTALYDITVLNWAGLDVFGGNLTNRLATESQVAYVATPEAGYFNHGPLIFYVDNNSATSAESYFRLYYRSLE